MLIRNQLHEERKCSLKYLLYICIKELYHIKNMYILLIYLLQETHFFLNHACFIHQSIRNSNAIPFCRILNIMQI